MAISPKACSMAITLAAFPGRIAARSAGIQTYSNARLWVPDLRCTAPHAADERDSLSICALHRVRDTPAHSSFSEFHLRGLLQHLAFLSGLEIFVRGKAERRSEQRGG